MLLAAFSCEDDNGSDLHVRPVAVEPDCPSRELAAELMEMEVSLLPNWPATAWGDEAAGNPQTRVACTFMPFTGEAQTNQLPNGEPTVYIVVTEFDSAEGLTDHWKRTREYWQDCAEAGCSPEQSDLNNRDDDYDENSDHTVQRIVNIQHTEIQEDANTFIPVDASYIVHYRIGFFHCEATFSAMPDNDRDVEHVLAQLEEMARSACPALST